MSSPPKKVASRVSAADLDWLFLRGRSLNFWTRGLPAMSVPVSFRSGRGPLRALNFRLLVLVRTLTCPPGLGGFASKSERSDLGRTSKISSSSSLASFFGRLGGLDRKAPAGWSSVGVASSDRDTASPNSSNSTVLTLAALSSLPTLPTWLAASASAMAWKPPCMTTVD